MVIVDIKPIFGKADFTTNDKLAFVLMPFSEDLTEIYYTYIKPIVEGKELECRRADDFKTSTIIMQDIWHSICQSRVVIADLTYRNPNVMYELGIAHTLGKDTILIYQYSDVNDRFPFDLAHIRRIEYENTAMGANKLTSCLSTALSEVLDGKPYHLSSDDMLNIELKNYLQSEYIRRVKRIDYFSYHSLDILKDFKRQHVELLNNFSRFMDERSEQSIRAIMAIANAQGQYAKDHIFPFIKAQLDKVEDYLESAWLVNKFPDELFRIGDAMNRVRNSDINIHTNFEDLQHIIELTKYRINRIEHYIEIIEQERKAIGLPLL